MVFTWKLTCLFSEKHSGHCPPITFLCPALLVWPIWEKRIHAESISNLAAWKVLYGFFWMFSSTIYAMLNHGCVICVWKTLCLDSSDFELTWLSCHAVVITVSSAYPKTPLLSPLLNHINYIKFILVLWPYLRISQEVLLARRGYKLFLPHEANFLWFLLWKCRPSLGDQCVPSLSPFSYTRKGVFSIYLEGKL